GVYSGLNGELLKGMIGGIDEPSLYANKESIYLIQAANGNSIILFIELSKQRIADMFASLSQGNGQSGVVLADDQMDNLTANGHEAAFFRDKLLADMKQNRMSASQSIGTHILNIESGRYRVTYHDMESL